MNTNSKFVYYEAKPMDPFNDLSGKNRYVGCYPPDTAITAASVVTQMDWSTCCKTFLKVMHQRKQMPEVPACAEQMLHNLGFVPQTIATTRGHTCEEMIDFMNRNYADSLGKVKGAILFCSLQNHFRIRVYVPIVRSADGSWIAMGANEHLLTYQAERLYILSEGKKDQSLNPSRNYKKKPPKEQNDFPFKETESAVYFQPNKKHSCNDCVPRAIAGLYQVSINKAVDLIVEAYDYKSCFINNSSVYPQLLKRSGFVKFDFDGKFSDLCQKLNSMGQEREYSVLALNPRHAVAILPKRRNDGKLQYQIHDSWDSSDEWCNSYWIIPGEPEYRASTRIDVNDPCIGVRICDPWHGFAIIKEVIEIQGRKYVIAAFEHNEQQICLGMEYVRKHCIPRVSEEWIFFGEEDDLPF